MLRKLFLGLILTCAFGTVSWGSGLLRVVHLSPDAPDVDVYVDGDLVLEDVPFTASSPYLPLPAGTYQIQVTPAGEPSPVVIDAPVSVADGQARTVVATGLLGQDDLLPIVLDDDRVSVPATAKVRFIHASPDAPPVDVALAGGAVLFPAVEFRQATDYLEVAPGSYDLEVRLAGTSTVVLPLGAVEFGEGTNTEAFAIGLVGDNTLNALTLLSAEPGPAFLRIAHLSPDAPNVDVRANGALLAENVPFSTISDYLEVEAGTYQVQVSPTGQAQPVVIDETLTLVAGEGYTVAATGLLGADDLAATPLVDALETDPSDARVRFVHASADAPPVDVAVTGGPVLFPDFEFRESSDYLPVAPGTYDLEVRLAGTDTVVLPLPGVEIPAGVNITVFAAGLVSDMTLTAIPAIDVNDIFVRGDANRDGNINLADAYVTLVSIFGSTPVEVCADAADFNDDGHVTLSDPIQALNFIFSGGPSPTAPYPQSGTDLTDDALGCDF